MSRNLSRKLHLKGLYHKIDIIHKKLKVNITRKTAVYIALLNILNRIDTVSYFFLTLAIVLTRSNEKTAGQVHRKIQSRQSNCSWHMARYLTTKLRDLRR
jgi:hypothetical protein